MDSSHDRIPDEFDIDRLADLLAMDPARVAEVIPIGTGQMAGSYRVNVGPQPNGEEAADAHGVTVVVKVPKGTPEQRLLAANSYRTEVDFYTELAPLVDARLPRLLGGWRNEAGDDFMLVLEDLAPWRVGDQLTGCDRHQAAAAVENLAAVHGALWNEPRVAQVLPMVGDAEVEGTAAVFGILTEMFLAGHRDQLDDATVDICERFAPLASRFLAAQADRVGIVHGDYRLDNLLFSADGDECAVIDWQTAGCGLPARDLAYFLGTSLTVEDRRAHGDELIADYHGALGDHAIEGYELGTCRDEYAFGLFQIPLTVMFGSAIAASTDRGAAMFDVMITRGAAAIRDAATLDLV